MKLYLAIFLFLFPFASWATTFQDGQPPSSSTSQPPEATPQPLETPPEGTPQPPPATPPEGTPQPPPETPPETPSPSTTPPTDEPDQSQQCQELLQGEFSDEICEKLKLEPINASLKENLAISSKIESSEDKTTCQVEVKSHGVSLSGEHLKCLEMAIEWEENEHLEKNDGGTDGSIENDKLQEDPIDLKVSIEEAETTCKFPAKKSLLEGLEITVSRKFDNEEDEQGEDEDEDEDNDDDDDDDSDDSIPNSVICEWTIELNGEELNQEKLSEHGIEVEFKNSDSDDDDDEGIEIDCGINDDNGRYFCMHELDANRYKIILEAQKDGSSKESPVCKITAYGEDPDDDDDLLLPDTGEEFRPMSPIYLPPALGVYPTPEII